MKSRCSRATNRLLSFRSLLAVTAFVLLGLGLGPATSQAVVHAVTINGQFTLFDVPSEISLDDPDPLTSGDTFTITFDLDDSVPRTGGTATVSSYSGAISNFAMTISTGATLSMPSEDVLAADNGSNHQWSVTTFIGDPGFMTTLPTLLPAYNSDEDDTETFFLTEFNLVLVDTSTSAYASSPPELVVPSNPPFNINSADFSWDSDGPTGLTIQTESEINSITSVPLASPVPAMGISASLMLVCGIGFVAWRKIERSVSA